MKHVHGFSMICTCIDEHIIFVNNWRKGIFSKYDSSKMQKTRVFTVHVSVIYAFCKLPLRNTSMVKFVELSIFRVRASRE